MVNSNYIGCGLADIQLDSALLEKQSEAYAVKGVDESEPAKPIQKKRKQAYTNGEDVRIARGHRNLNQTSADACHRKRAVAP
jgi:hypothetical protein